MDIAHTIIEGVTGKKCFVGYSRVAQPGFFCATTWGLHQTLFAHLHFLFVPVYTAVVLL